MKGAIQIKFIIIIIIAHCGQVLFSVAYVTHPATSPSKGVRESVDTKQQHVHFGGLWHRYRRVL